MDDESPLVRLGEAIDNGELQGIVSKYKCEKCGREAEWETYVGIPMKKIPCGGNCNGYLVLQYDNKGDKNMVEDEYEKIKKDSIEMAGL